MLGVVRRFAATCALLVTLGLASPAAAAAADPDDAIPSETRRGRDFDPRVAENGNAIDDVTTDSAGQQQGTWQDPDPNRVFFSVGIRFYDMIDLKSPARSRALHVADQILAGAQLSAAWTPCTRNPRTTAAHCADTLGKDELVLRVVRGPRPRLGSVSQQSLGDSLIDRTTGDGVLATIYMDRVEWLARESHTDAALLLGRAIAHEIGHLVLGTVEHTAHGLMRPAWTADELAANRPEDWTFSREDSTRVWVRVARVRQTGPPPAAGAWAPRTTGS